MSALPPDFVVLGFSMETTRHRNELRSSLRDAHRYLSSVRDAVEADRPPILSDLRAALASVSEAYARAMALDAVQTAERFARPAAAPESEPTGGEPR